MIKNLLSRDLVGEIDTKMTDFKVAFDEVHKQLTEKIVSAFSGYKSADEYAH